MAQAAIYTTGVASFAAATEAGLIDPARITALAGLRL